MIRQDDLDGGTFGRLRQLLVLIRAEKLTFAGNRRLKIYGKLDCRSGKKMQTANRVFFADEAEALSFGYRPCGHCTRLAYRQWKNKKNMIQPATTENLLPYDGHAVLYPHFLDTETCAYYLQEIRQHVAWKQEAIRMFGKEVMQPRLTAWYGDAGKAYSYSGITMQPLPWTAALATLKTKIETLTGYQFNSALLNLYRDGSDSMGWHRDNEKELGPEPVIASLSLGSPRLFQLRHYQYQKTVVPVVLEPGSLLVMSGSTQTYWQHRLPKTKAVNGIRINITFRYII